MNIIQTIIEWQGSLPIAFTFMSCAGANAMYQSIHAGNVAERAKVIA